MNNKKYYLYILISLIIYLFSSCGIEDAEIDERDVPYSKELLSQKSQYLIILGDVQEYSEGGYNGDFYISTIYWILYQINQGIDIKCIIMTGDATWYNMDYQWAFYSKYSSLLENYVPFISAVGNHDYTWDSEGKIRTRNSTKINEYASFSKLKSSIVSYFEKDHIENIIVKVNLIDRIIYIISLEFGPRDEVIDWAIREVTQHPERKYVLLTHEWLARGGKRVVDSSYAQLQFDGFSSWNSPQMVWDKLVYPNDNISFVLCGHNGFFEQLYSENSKKRLVPQLLFNLQYFNNGGDGWIQIFEIPFREDSIIVNTYNVITDSINSDPRGSFRILL